jgi:hypothetical protein
MKLEDRLATITHDTMDVIGILAKIELQRLRIITEHKIDRYARANVCATILWYAQMKSVFDIGNGRIAVLCQPLGDAHLYGQCRRAAAR